MAPFNVTTSVTGDARVALRFAKAGSFIRDRIRSILAEAADQTIAAAQSGAPVLKRPRKGRTAGALRSSIRGKLTETASAIAVSIKPGAFYARFVEFGVVSHGTRKNASGKGGKLVKVARVRALRGAGAWRVPPHPFMGPATRGVPERVRAAIAASLVTVGSEV